RTVRQGPPTVASACDADLAEVAQHTWMDTVSARRRGQRVGGGGLARLWQASRERGLTPVERARQPMDHAVGEIRPRKDEAPRADRGERCFETRIGAGGDRHRLEEGVLREDP